MQTPASAPKPTFRCPACNDKISFLGGTVIKLVARLHAEHFSAKTMVYIPARLGQYGVIVGEGVRIRDGARLELECPHSACKRNLTSPHDDALAQVLMTDPEGHEYVVVFSKIFGKHATFLLDLKRRSLVETYGEHASSLDLGDKPLNFFGD